MLRLKWMMLAAILYLPLASQGAQPVHADSPSIPVAELSAEVRDTLRAIKQSGPFAYPRDGVVFNNFENILPRHGRGYYHEYTVATPGANNRGVRRIVCGPLPECYYSADHYQSFKRIRE